MRKLENDEDINLIFLFKGKNVNNYITQYVEKYFFLKVMSKMIIMYSSMWKSTFFYV